MTYWPAPTARIRCAGPGRHTRAEAEHDYRRALRRAIGKDADQVIRALFDRTSRRANLADARWIWIEGRPARVEQWEEQLTTDDNMWQYLNSGKIRLRFPGPWLLGATQHTKDLSGPARGTRETAVMDRDELFVRLQRGDTLQQIQAWLSACRTAPQPRTVAVPLLCPKKDQRASGKQPALLTRLLRAQSQKDAAAGASCRASTASPRSRR